MATDPTALGSGPVAGDRSLPTAETVPGDGAVAGGRTYVTRQSLAGDLRKLGVCAGRPLLVHVSLRSLGWVAGGAAGVVGALREVVGPGETIVVPAMTEDNSDTSRVYCERTREMSDEERSRYRARMPAFDQATTPSSGMGRVAEYVRTSAGAIRSAHPQSSFAALGPDADRLMRYHAEDCHLGERSPLGLLYEADAQILMLGTGYDRCTAFHLAEYRYTENPPRRRYACVVNRDGAPTWWQYEDVKLDDSDFGELGAALDSTPYVARGTVGDADSRLISLRIAVDFAVGWFAARRSSRSDRPVAERP